MRRLLPLMLCFCLLAPCALAEDATTCAAWLPYWEVDDSIAEAVACEGRFSELIAFAAIFNTEDRLLQPEGLPELLTRLHEAFDGVTPIFLSVVNDVEIGEGIYENKTAEPIRRLLASDEAMDGHIDELLALCMETGVDGLEIDYENFRADVALWERYAVFLERLYARATEQGLRLRAVLSWDAARYAALPAGPEYSVMCYNLFGYHSGPGPKADAAFLQQCYQLNLGLPGEKRMAYATGGFDWANDAITAVTQREAEALIARYAALPERDEESGAIRFTYLDVAGLSHEVWYEDGETLNIWRAQAVSQGYRAFDLFRLSGNNVEDLLEFLP